MSPGKYVIGLRCPTPTCDFSHKLHQQTTGRLGNLLPASSRFCSREDGARMMVAVRRRVRRVPFEKPGTRAASMRPRTKIRG